MRFFSAAQLTIILATCCLLQTGCPDYSNQRPAPDYKNMVDPGTPDSEAPEQ